MECKYRNKRTRHEITYFAKELDKVGGTYYRIERHTTDNKEHSVLRTVSSSVLLSFLNTEYIYLN